MAEGKLFTRSEVEKNNEIDEVLIILHDKVYNVYNFLNEHPGGEEILLDHRGKDSSEDFDDVGHSKDAMQLMKKYQVGTLVESERSNVPPKKGWVAAYSKDSKTKTESSMPIGLIVGGFILIASLYYCIM